MISINTYLLLVVLIVFVAKFEAASNSKILLTVYYESKCPDSRSFMRQQLLPAMRQLHEHVRMRFVPFGKATYASGAFECQHGYTECYWNMVHDCTINLMKGRPDMDILNYVVCEMNYAKKSGLICSEKAGVSRKQVQICLDSSKGKQLQLISEAATNRIQPKFIPTITINDHFDQAVQNSAMVDLKDTLCSFLTNTNACKKHYNYQALRYLISTTPDWL